MNVEPLVVYSQQMAATRLAEKVSVVAAKRGLNQQKLEGEAALKLMDAAAVPIDPSLGRHIDIYV